MKSDSLPALCSSTVSKYLPIVLMKSVLFALSTVVAMGSTEVVNLAASSGTTGVFDVFTSSDCSSGSKVATVTWDTLTAW